MELFIQGIEHPKRVPANGEESLLNQLALAGFGQMVYAPCGGNGTCRQCTVTVSGRLAALSGEEREFDREEVLACRWRPAGDVTVRLNPATGQDSHIAVHSRDIPGGGEGLGLAVDIGTTTVAAYLYDLASGRCLHTAAGMNAQRVFGGDVISRIQYCEQPGGLEQLCAMVRDQVRELAASMCPDLTQVRRLSIAGNTVMEHIFAGLSPVSIGVAPFTPVSLFGDSRPAAQFYGEGCFHPEAELYLSPCVAGYVGGDITAGLLSSGACDSDKTVLFLDIGTNGEMGIGDKNGFLTCATAAGPAFEGAEIACGSSAQDGAINRVEPDLSYTVIGGGKPKTICGSGIIDGVAALLYNEVVDETGRMEEERHTLGGEVYLCGTDIRKIQLAKAAIRAGIETLLATTGKTYDDIDQLLIAGGFGAYVDIGSACAIGLLPPALRYKTRHVGNSSGMGAAMALDPGLRAKLARVDESCQYVELSSSKVFNDKYIEAMMFDEWEDVLGD